MTEICSFMDCCTSKVC